MTHLLVVIVQFDVFGFAPLPISPSLCCLVALGLFSLCSLTPQRCT